VVQVGSSAAVRDDISPAEDFPFSLDVYGTRFVSDAAYIAALEAENVALREALRRIGDLECLDFGNGYSCLNGNEPTQCATCSAISALAALDATQGETK
jgi:hypothetical protein